MRASHMRWDALAIRALVGRGHSGPSERLFVPLDVAGFVSPTIEFGADSSSRKRAGVSIRGMDTNSRIRGKFNI